jgi:ABC-type sugar transport system ATPase subunit
VVDEPGIRLESIGFRIGEFALEDICLEVRRGEYFVLTGPNGAGKTVLVKLIAGLHSPEAGEILIRGERVTETPPWERNIGYVPQEYALFPNLTVHGNIGFGLKVRKVEKSAIEELVRVDAELLGISHLLHRMPKGLSGGEQQKVALARALALRPTVLLLDEPVSAIDEDSRDAICAELKKIQRQTRVTTVHVSHNRREAELVADRIGVLKDGGIEIVPAARPSNDI